MTIDLWQWNCWNRRKNKFVAPKIGGVNQPINSPLPLILILYLEYIHWSFPIKLNLLISRLKSMSEILFCLFISPLRNKRQVPWLKDCISPQSYILRLFSYSSALLQCAQLHHKVTSSDCSVTLLLCFSVHNYLTKLHPPIVQLLFCFASVCTTKNCKFWVNVRFFALLINLQL